MVNGPVYLFPGQGSQFSGMASDLYDRYDAVKELFRMASDACGRDMKKLLFDGTEDELKETENAQPAIVLASLAALEGMRAEGFTSGGAAGHSLGEYTAMVDTGVLSAADALRAVTARGAFMAASSARIVAEKGEIGMAAVIGIGPSVVRRALEGFDEVWSANENGPAQIAIGGTKAGMDAAADALKAAGAKRIIPLKVSCPFHTPLMAEPARAMAEFLAGISFRDPVKPVWSNVLADVVGSGEDARRLLVEQVTHPVRWMDLMTSIAASSPPALYEVGPGTVLAGLWNKSGLEGNCLPAGSVGDLKNIRESK